jgi:hypothetical protein
VTASCRPWWRNCALGPDTEILEIDALEDRVAPLGANLTAVRELISSLELCHHKAERWVYNVVEAIGSGGSEKGLGTRPPGQHHAVETIWRNACAVLSVWCAGHPGAAVDLAVGTVPAARLLASLGERSPLKEWQVQRVIDKIRSSIGWPGPLHDPASQYAWILLGGGEHESFYLDSCPEHYREHEDFWLATVRTTIRDTVDGGEARLSLGLAIDLLMPCHWRFVENLEIVLDAIGGRLEPVTPFAACGRNIGLSPLRPRMQVVSATLRAFSGIAEPGPAVDGDLLSELGEATDAKRWLALSLDKTIRLQLDPPADVRAMCAMTGPDWIGEAG